MSRVWCDVDHCYYEIETQWSGSLYRQNAEKYSLLGEGWATKEPVLGQYKPGLEKNTYVTQQEARKAKAADPFVLNPNTAGPTYVGPCAGGCGKEVIGERKCASCRRRSGTHAASNGRPKRYCACGQQAKRGSQRCSQCAQPGKVGGTACRSCTQRFPLSELSAKHRMCKGCRNCPSLRSPKEAA